jgi:hypothetical protein
LLGSTGRRRVGARRENCYGIWGVIMVGLGLVVWNAPEVWSFV